MRSIFFQRCNYFVILIFNVWWWNYFVIHVFDDMAPALFSLLCAVCLIGHILLHEMSMYTYAIGKAMDRLFIQYYKNSQINCLHHWSHSIAGEVILFIIFFRRMLQPKYWLLHNRGQGLYASCRLMDPFLLWLCANRPLLTELSHMRLRLF